MDEIQGKAYLQANKPENDKELRESDYFKNKARNKQQSVTRQS